MIELKIQKSLQAANGAMNLTLDISIPQGSFITLYGESGAGKTSTLRMLAGLMDPDGGRITVNNEVWYDTSKKICLTPQKRKIGYVFQDYALFPNMTVRKNLEYALGKNQDPQRINTLIEITELSALQNRKPETLSGGQKQRVALARALVQQPEILLLDEPLAALDSKIRLRLQDYIKQVHQEFNLTTILVSHDIGEIVKLSDQVIVLEAGKVKLQGSSEEVFINKQLSGKFKFTGEILKIEKEEIVYIITVLIHSNVVKVVAQESEVHDMKIGDKVVVASKAFNPIIYKLDSPI
ncbi:MAG: molybdate transport system ATP-binding protein [Saprospiraceae bacterium]|jgi:molybdate transport system ATP-binding protein